MTQGNAGKGRAKGSVNKRSADLLAKVESEGITPLAYMLATLRNEAADPKDRQWAADKSAAFIHPRPQPQARPVIVELPDTSTSAGIAKAIGAVLAATARGAIAPSEGRDLVALLDARLKAFETVEIEERIRRLEERQTS